MNIATVAETALRWGISPARVKQLLALGVVKGAQKIGRDWAIPANAARPKMRGRKAQ
jgi:hypothetical protein